MKLIYKGTDERVFPSLSMTVKPGDEFDAPEGFSHPDCIASDTKAAPSKAAPKVEVTDGDKDGLVQDNTPFEIVETIPTPSAASDLTKQESE